MTSQTPGRRSTRLSCRELMESVLVEVSMVKYLGISFDSNLTWKNHVNDLCLKLSKTVGIFSKLRYYVNVDILIML